MDQSDKIPDLLKKGLRERCETGLGLVRSCAGLLKLDQSVGLGLNGPNNLVKLCSKSLFIRIALDIEV